jgi:hypothetical protein
MRKMILLAVAASLSLSLAVLAADQPASGSAPEAKAKARSQARGRMDPAAQKKMVTDQLAALKTEHQAAQGELQAIKQLAVKEKATETAAALDKLMARHEQAYQKKIEPLQQRLKRLEGGQKQGEGAKKGTGEKAGKKSGGKKKTQ